jgi:uncharacterized RDD family membrane protein YckC
MNWYYVEAGRQAGPFTEAEFLDLVQTGKVQPDTLVWHEGLANWQPYLSVKPSPTLAAAPGAPSGLRLPSGSTGATAADTAAPPVAEVVCAECGKIFSRDNAIQYGTLWVCAECKPVFMQRIKEGATLPTAVGAMNYAGFWIRFAAILIDGLILWVVNTIISFLFGFGFTMNPFQPSNANFTFMQLGLLGVLVLVQTAVGACYETFFLGRFGATPGKMTLRLKVVNADGTSISYLKACGRYFAKWLSYLTCSIGFIIAAFDEQKRTLHDHICNTRVVQQ